MLADPETRAAVDEIRDEMRQSDRAYAMGLAAVRKAAQLTQTELPERMGIGQSALSSMERRHDRRLSTLALYLTAAGASDVTIQAALGGQTVVLPLRPAAERESQGE